MIASGADVNAAQGDGTTPLHWAVYKIDADLTRALLARGAKADVINSYGSSPLAEAVKIGNRILLLTPHPGRAKAEINCSGLDTRGADGELLSARIQRLLFERTGAIVDV